MGKDVKVNVEGFGTVLIAKPKKYNPESFADGVGEAVAGAVNLVFERDRTSFHPVLGRGGYDWDHETQAADVSEASTPRVSIEESGILRVYLLPLWRHVRDFSRNVRDTLLGKDR